VNLLVFIITVLKLIKILLLNCTVFRGAYTCTIKIFKNPQSFCGKSVAISNSKKNCHKKGFKFLNINR